MLSEELILKLDKTKCYCQKCLLENHIIPLSYNIEDKNNSYIEIKCNHTGRNCNTLRFHNNEWHLFYGYLKESKCRTCQAKDNLKIMNDPNGIPRQKLKNWYNSDKCKKILKQNADNWRNSETGKLHAISNCEKYRNSKNFKEHGADSLINYLKTDNFKEHIKNHNKENCEKLNNYHEEFCNKCNKITIHNGFGTCGTCNPTILGSLPNFITKNNVRYYKNKELNQLCENLLSEKEDISNYPGFDIRLGRVCYNRKDVLTDDKILLNGNNFIIKDNVEFVLNHFTGKYEEKNEFYNKYNNYINSLNVNNEIQKFIDLGFNLEPIIKINDENWNREQTDKMLVEKGYGWICYIKLFQGKPFIVGKTGTRLVSNSPIDFDFKVFNENNLYDNDYLGIGRIYIKEYYPNIKYTDFDKILIKNFESEKEAYEFENFCLNKFNLFSS